MFIVEMEYITLELTAFDLDIIGSGILTSLKHRAATKQCHVSTDSDYKDVSKVHSLSSMIRISFEERCKLVTSYSPSSSLGQAGSGFAPYIPLANTLGDMVNQGVPLPQINH